MGGSSRAIKPRKPVYWEKEPLSLRAMSRRTGRGLTVLFFLILFYICIQLFTYLEKQDNLTSDTHDGDSNLNESVEAFIDPVKNSIDLNDNDGKDSSFNNNAKPLHNLLEATHKVFPEVNGNEVVVNVMEILTTIPVTPDPLSHDGVVNADGQAEVTSNDSTALRAEDSCVKQSTLPSGVESMAAVSKDLRPANT